MVKQTYSHEKRLLNFSSDLELDQRDSDPYCARMIDTGEESTSKELARDQESFAHRQTQSISQNNS